MTAANGPETSLPWGGYGPVPDPDEWQRVAEWLHCKAIHGDLGDTLAGEEADTSRSQLVLDVLEEAAEAILRAADRLRRGHTEEACSTARHELRPAAAGPPDRTAAHTIRE